MVSSQAALLIVFFSAILFPVIAPVKQRFTVLGLIRGKDSIKNCHGYETHIIPNTVQCEDLHLHKESGLLFAACQGNENADARWQWFPPLEKFNPDGAIQGSLIVVDPIAFTSKKLKITGGFEGPFVTHGIDIFTDPADPTLLHIFAINHLPDPNHFDIKDDNNAASPNKTRSQVEVFRHYIGSSTAQHVRSIRDPMIKTPNDILATSPTTFYVTNDHYYRSGHLRVVEELLTQYLAGWSDIVHVSIIDPTEPDPTRGTHITTALTGLHNNNGLGRSSSTRPEEVLIVDASGGVLTRSWRSNDTKASPKLNVVEHIQFDTTLDNPFFYDDQWATSEDDASGYVLAGLPRAGALGADFSNPDVPIPCTVWYSRKDGTLDEKKGPSHQQWPKRVLWQDNGRLSRSASTAVLIGVDPMESGGRKMGWLFVTGFAGKGIVASKVYLGQDAEECVV